MRGTMVLLNEQNLKKLTAYLNDEKHFYDLDGGTVIDIAVWHPH